MRIILGSTYGLTKKFAPGFDNRAVNVSSIFPGILLTCRVIALRAYEYGEVPGAVSHKFILSRNVIINIIFFFVICTFKHIIHTGSVFSCIKFSFVLGER